MTVSLVDEPASAIPAADAGWRAGPVTFQVLRALTTIVLLSVLSRVAMAFRDVALANRFGTHDAVDAFVLALVLPLYAIQFVAAALPSAFLPTYSMVRSSEGDAVATRLVGNVVALVVVPVGIVTGLLALGAPVFLRILGSGFGAEKLELTRSLYLILLPILFFGAVSAVYGAVLNVDRKFALAAATPALAPLGAFLVLVAGPASWGIRGVAWGTTIGALCEALVLGMALRRRGISPWPRWSGADEHLRGVVRQYLPAAGGIFLMSGATVVDQAVAAAHGAGSVSALNYGGKVASFFVGVGTVAIGTVVLPHVSAIVARHDWAGVRRTIRSYARLALGVTIPITLLMIAMSRWIVAVAFEHGAFTAADAHVVTKVQICYILQIPFFMVGIIGIRSLAALRRNQLLMVIGALNIVTNIVADLVFVHYFGVAGIALSTTLVYMLAATASFVATERVLRREQQRSAFAPVR